MDAPGDAAAAVASRLEWDAFLSFGVDTFLSFTTRLYGALERHNVRAFMDDKGLSRGDEIMGSAISDSAAAVVVLSPRYAETWWCLEELARLCQCRGKLLLPVFYGVDPSDVRRQRGPFEEAFRVHEKTFEAEKIGAWRDALARVGGIAGWVIKDENSGDEAKIIESLVNNVLTAIRKTPIGLADYTVGLQPKVDQLTNLLDLNNSDGVLVLGLHGIGGVGKTTLAKALFNNLVSRGFKLRSFLPNVRDVSSQQGGLKSLQQKLIDDISNGSLDMKNDDRTGFKRAMLVVLDDVDDLSQLDALVTEKRKWLSKGSRVIITTRNIELLNEKYVDLKYEVRELDSDKALELFSHYAFRRKSPPDDFKNLSAEIVSLTGGLPLALEVFGSLMFEKARVPKSWRDSMQKLKQNRPSNLQGVMKISYDALNEEEKCVFLDITCLFVRTRMNRDYAVDVFNGCGVAGKVAIATLMARSLVKVTEDNELWVHDQVRDLGCQIVREESVVDPFMRSRLWTRDDIMSVLRDNKREKSTQGIVLDFVRKPRVKDVDAARIAWNELQATPSFSNAWNYVKHKYKQYRTNEAEKKRKATICAEHLEKMPKLRLLQVNYVNLEGRLVFPPDLRWLQWKECTLKHFPSSFRAPGLAVLDLSDSQIERVWDRYDNKAAKSLKILNLNGCSFLAALPNFSADDQKLEKLYLQNCVSLSKIDEEIGKNVATLVHLDLTQCTNLVKFPSDVSGLKCLDMLILSGCLKLKDLPTNIGSMESLKSLLIDDTAIESLPDSIFQLTKLEILSLNRCKLLKKLPPCVGKLHSLKQLSMNNSGLEELPDSVGSLKNLEKLSVIWCSSLSILPDSIGGLQLLLDFSLSSSAITKLPDCVGSLPNLRSLTLGKGDFIKRLPCSIGGLHSLVTLEINETSITCLPDEIKGLKSLKKLELWKCRSLETLPESIGDLFSLTELVIFQGIIKELPESISNLENLTMLRLTQCKMLQRLPEKIGDMRSLRRLLLQETAVTKVPNGFGALSGLIVLNISTNPWARDAKVSEGLVSSSARNEVFFPDNSFSNLSLLTELNARGRKIAGKIPDDLEQLASLETLNLGHNDICRLPSSLTGLSVLKELVVSHCRELKSLPPLPASLIKLDVAQCTSLEHVSDVSNLERLEELNLTNCKKVEAVPGLESLKALKRLYMSCCNTCSSVTKRILSKDSLRKLRNLSMPGSDIPDWFSHGTVTFMEQRNRPIKGVTIAVVVSVNHQIEDDMRDRVPAIVDIQAQILNQCFPVFTTVLILTGVPNRSEDQVHLCRYSVNSPLVLMLKDGFKITVTMKNPPCMKSVELKKWGIHLIYKNDDDYEGDEEWLNGTQNSVSEKLARFFNASDSISNNK